jgi:hypothetical protein
LPQPFVARRLAFQHCPVIRAIHAAQRASQHRCLFGRPKPTEKAGAVTPLVEG